MESEEYLYHHGVKGMKWGVRKDKGKVSSRISRKERKQIHRDYYTIGKSERKKANKKYGVEEKWNVAEKRAQKVYDKKGTSAIAEDKTYQKLYNDYNKVATKAKIEGGKKTQKIMMQKYGKEKLDNYDKYNLRKLNATVYTAFVGMPLLTTVLGGAYLYSKYKK